MEKSRDQEYHQIGLRIRKESENHRTLYMMLFLVGVLVILCTFQPFTQHEIKKRSVPSSSIQLKQEILRGGVKIRGVNLCGWLLVSYKCTEGAPLWEDYDNSGDPWKGEYYALKGFKRLGVSKEKVREKLENHWSQFITEADFREIAAHGFNTIRIPVGYWITGDGTDLKNLPDPYIEGALKYLDKAIQWAESYNLGVLISMQAVPGSQNGFEGSSPEKFGEVHWIQNDANIKKTRESVKALAKRYKNRPAFLGIGLLSEPNFETQFKEKLRKYYNDSIQAIRKDIGANCLITTSPLLHEQSAPFPDWQRFGRDHRDFQMQEWHWYQAFNGIQDAEKNIAYARDVAKEGVKMWEKYTANTRLLMGEWSLATENDDMTPDQLKRFAEAQLNAYRLCRGGWIFNAWKHFNDDLMYNNPWSMKSLINGKIFTKQMITA